MKIKRGQKLFILGLAIGFVFTWFIFQSARAANASETEVTLPADLSVDSVDDLLAGLSDEQVRSLLIKELKSEALRQAEEEAARSAGSLEQSATLLKRRARMVLSGIPILVPEMGRALHKLTQGRGLGRFILILLAALALVAGAWMVERLFRGRLAALRQQLGESEPETFSLRVRRIFLRALLDVFSLGVFFLAGFILFSFFFPESGPLRVFAARFFLALTVLRVYALASEIALSPDSRPLRIVPVSDENALFLHRGIIVMFAVWLFGVFVSVLMKDLGAQVQVFALLRILAQHLGAIVLVYLIWKKRKEAADAIRGDAPPAADGRPTPREQFAGVWYILAIIYVVVMVEFWVVSSLLQGKVVSGNLLYSFLLIPAFLALERIGVKGLRWIFSPKADEAVHLEESLNVSGESAEGQPVETAADPEPAPETPEKPIAEDAGWERYYTTAQGVMRLVLVVGFVLAMIRMWNVRLPLAEYLTGGMVEIFVTLFVAAVVWQYTKIAIQRRIGGAGDSRPGLDFEMGLPPGQRGRSKTLLLLLQKFIGAALIVFVVLIVLSALGINIGPLLAGAGVFGIAIGFGGQTLVRDIISGVFYLSDDAFRIGDYIEAGSVSGTVEHISIRAIRLRHHRGKLQFVPYGAMGVVTNYMRGPVINKFNFRLPYDTDINKFRKIVKQAGKRLLQDEELAPHLVETVKSQGVKTIEDSALIFRVKLAAMPPYHILAKRQAFTLITEELNKAGIQFAHRNVTVNWPHSEKDEEDEVDENGLETETATQGEVKPEQKEKDPQPKEPDPSVIGAGAAAAITSVIADEEKKK
jgi:small-conductance mechanosensitive channel